ncbi:hypothetical protein OM076_06630 [Solirubrobacter ginsenosidimutans]|uniref:Uncharacterized protein n=1 Tax=Solirubrobacter ginsenosidimutans TaxID=490573 RepID=A0A9X3RZ92_9ACTN|nr:hypothetical protein [Solirubrobacter ginsenosidimutans]MDA0159929.1 hypothetical protein [Solirubrobacter ginsenosidimutans]
MRRLLTEGTEVTVRYLAVAEHGVVERVEDGGRTVVVVTDRGELLRFHLMASAHYVTRDRAARLQF